MICQGRQTEAVQGWGLKPLEGKNSTLARSTRLLRATTRRFRLILSGREACRANGCPGEYTTKLCPEVLGRLLRSHRTCCSYVTRHHSKKKVRICACAVRPTSCRSIARTPMRGLMQVVSLGPKRSRSLGKTQTHHGCPAIRFASGARSASLPRISICHPEGARPSCR